MPRETFARCFFATTVASTVAYTLFLLCFFAMAMDAPWLPLVLMSSGGGVLIGILTGLVGAWARHTVVTRFSFAIEEGEIVARATKVLTSFKYVPVGAVGTEYQFAKRTFLSRQRRMMSIELSKGEATIVGPNAAVAALVRQLAR
ncbi:MAG: hypothetical protein ACRELB_12630 [Polyangiaceae bacterium]